MKTNVRRFIQLHLTALLLTFLPAGFAKSAKSHHFVPFRGAINGVEIVTFQFPFGFVDATGAGNASHLGRFTLAYELELNFLAQETSGSAVFTAANGDRLFTEIVGHGTALGGFVSVVETHTITGGTGRFEGATGSFVRTYLLNLATGVTSGSFDGTIGIP